MFCFCFSVPHVSSFVLVCTNVIDSCSFWIDVLFLLLLNQFDLGFDQLKFHLFIFEELSLISSG